MKLTLPRDWEKLKGVTPLSHPLTISTPNMADLQIPLPATIDPAHQRVPMEDPVQLPNGEYEQVQKFDMHDSEPAAIKVGTNGQTVEEFIRTFPPSMLDFLHWGNLSKAGVKFSDEFLSRHADRLDWNMMSLFAPFSPKAAAENKARLVPHMLMKNPNLNDEVLAVVADRLDLDRVVKELKISSDFAQKNIDVLNVYDLIKYQKLNDAFWLGVLRSYQTSPIKLIELATRIAEAQDLGMEFVNGVQAITTEVNLYLQKNPIPGIALPLRILDGATLIRRAKMDHPFIISLLSYNYPEERKREIKQQMVAYQDLSAEIIQRFYSGPEDLDNEELCYQILSRQPVPAEYLNSQGKRILTIARFRVAVATRQNLSDSQIEALLAAAEPDQRTILINILVVRAMHEPTHLRALNIGAETYAKLTPLANWAFICSMVLTHSQACYLLNRETARLHWREFITANRKVLSEEDLENAQANNNLGPLEWVLILTAEDKNKKLVRLTPSNSLGLYTADFLARHQARFDWWKYVAGDQVPRGMMNRRIEDLDHLRKQIDAILQVYVATADWAHLLRYEELPLWFLDGMKKYADRPEMNRGASFWWKVSVYQPLYTKPKFIEEHAHLLDMQMVAKNQLHEMFKKVGPTAVTQILRQYSDFLDDDSIEFINRNRDLSPLLQAVQAEKQQPSNPVPELAMANVVVPAVPAVILFWPGMEAASAAPTSPATSLPVTDDTPKPMFD